MSDHTSLNEPIRKRIQILSPCVANQIAAGEVVDRPASVLKEVLENSIDAHASRIDIELLNGGLSLIRITDNGVGIPQEELALSLCRHATSKIESTQDLENIRSLGFRGEALASIASVSKLVITSKVMEQDQAYQCRVKPENFEPEILSATHNNGTTVEVRDLFYNVPVRRKFLKSLKTEFERIDDMFKKIAFSHYSIHFTLTHNQKKIRDYPKALNATSRFERVQKIAGSAFAKSAYEVDFEQNGLRLWGYVGGPETANRHADCQYFFVNQRIIRDKVISHAIKTAFQAIVHELEGLHPSYVLYLELDPSEVDVNVHPTKHEVRFVQARLIHDFITQSLSAVLHKMDKIERVPQKWAPPLNLNTSTHFETLPVKLEASQAIETRWMKFNHYYIVSLKDQLLLIDMNKAKTKSDSSERFSLLFPIYVSDTLLSENDRFILQNAGFDFSKNIKEEWMLKTLPKNHDCVRMFTLQDMAKLFI